LLKSTSKLIWLPLLAIALVAGLYLLYNPNNKSEEAKNVNGVDLLLSPDTSSPNWPDNPTQQKAVLDASRVTMLKRLENLDFASTPRVVVKQKYQIEVFLPGIKNHTEAKTRITSGDALEFYLLTDVQSDSNPFGLWRMRGPLHTGEAFTFISPIGEQIDSLSDTRKFMTKVVGVPKTKPAFNSDDFLSNAKALRSKDKFAVLDLEFKPESGKRFAEFTKNNIGGVLAVIYGGKLLMAPEIREEIPDGKAEISGFANIGEAERMAQMVNSGTLQVGFHIDREEMVEPNK